MAESGLFRSAMRGFNKQDVLQYIDEITGAWDNERHGLEQQKNEAVQAQEAMQAQMEQAQADKEQAIEAANEASQKAQVAATQLAEVQQELYDITADLAECRSDKDEIAAQLEEAQRRIALLEAQLTAVTNERDDAIAAVADTKAQLTSLGVVEEQLNDYRQQNQRQSDQIDAMQQAIARYEKVLGNAETAHEHVDGIVRPFIEQANKQADETLDSVQAVLAGLLAQLGELQGNVEQRRQALHRCKADSDSRLSAAFGDWLGLAQDASASSGQFFR